MAIVMAIAREFKSGEREPWTRAIALVLVAAILALQLPSLVVARPLAGSCDPASACDPCDPAGDAVYADACCYTGASLACLVAQHEGAPDNKPCCPSDCKSCPLPCCGGVPLALNAPEAAVAQTVEARAFAQSAYLPPSIELGQIFHPPRRWSGSPTESCFVGARVHARRPGWS